MKKIALIGAGNIGGTLALLCAQKQLGDVVLFDINEGTAKGKALDLNQMGAVAGFESQITGTNDYTHIKEADVVIITAGLARKPDMSRDDLLKVNADIIKEVAQNVKTHCPNAFVVVITNPLDAMVWLFQKVSQLPAHKVVGMAGVLDSARFATFLADALQVSRCNVSAAVLGGHGDSMVPLIRHSFVAGESLPELVRQNKITEEQLAQIVERTRKGGGEIVGHLKNGSAFYTPAAAAIQMVEAYLHNKKTVLPCATALEGPYGVEGGYYVGVPVVLGNQGVEKVVEYSLTEEEQKMFNVSLNAVKELTASVESLVSDPE